MDSPLPLWWRCWRSPCFGKARAPCSYAAEKLVSARAAAAAPARLVLLLLAARRRPSPQDSGPAGFEPLGDSAELADFAAANSAALANSVAEATAATGEPGSTGAAARCSAAQCFAALWCAGARRAGGSGGGRQGARGTEGRVAAASLAHSEALRAASSPVGGSGRGYPRLWLCVPAESRDSGEHLFTVRRLTAWQRGLSISTYRQRRNTTHVVLRLLIDLQIYIVIYKYRYAIVFSVFFQRLSTFNLMSWTSCKPLLKREKQQLILLWTHSKKGFTLLLYNIKGSRPVNILSKYSLTGS